MRDNAIPARIRSCPMFYFFHRCHGCRTIVYFFFSHLHPKLYNPFVHSLLTDQQRNCGASILSFQMTTKPELPLNSVFGLDVACYLRAQAIRCWFYIIMPSTTTRGGRIISALSSAQCILCKDDNMSGNNHLCSGLGSGDITMTSIR